MGAARARPGERGAKCRLQPRAAGTALIRRPRCPGPALAGRGPERIGRGLRAHACGRQDPGARAFAHAPERRRGQWPVPAAPIVHGAVLRRGHRVERRPALSWRLERAPEPRLGFPSWRRSRAPGIVWRAARMPVRGPLPCGRQPGAARAGGADGGRVLGSSRGSSGGVSRSSSRGPRFRWPPIADAGLCSPRPPPGPPRDAATSEVAVRCPWARSPGWRCCQPFRALRAPSCTRCKPFSALRAPTWKYRQIAQGASRAEL